MNDDQLGRLLTRVADPDEFLPVSACAACRNSIATIHSNTRKGVGYEPAEAISRIKGGNSNWRGPVWFPTTYLLIESLRKLAAVYGDTFTYPPTSQGGPGMTLDELAGELSEGLLRLFRRGPDGMRPCDGLRIRFRDDPHWRDLLWFHEYFHADTGEGLGAHQTGWTALAASLITEKHTS